MSWNHYKMWTNWMLVIAFLLLPFCHCQQRRFDENINTHQFTPAKRYLQQQNHQQDILKKALQTQIQKPSTPVDVQDIFKSYKSLDVAKDAEHQQQASDAVSTEHQPQEQKTHNWLRNVIQSQLQGPSPAVSSIQDILKIYDNGAPVAQQQQQHREEVTDPRYRSQQQQYYQDSLRAALGHQLTSYSSPLVGAYRQGKSTEGAEPQENHPLLGNQQTLPLLHMLQMLASLQMLQGLGAGGSPYVDPLMMLLFGSGLGPPAAPPIPPYPFHNQQTH